MSKISIVLSKFENEAETVEALSPLLSIAEEEVHHIVGSGGKLIDDELFQDDSVELASKIRKVVSALEQLGDQFAIREFDDEIDRDTLNLILEDANSTGAG